MMGVLVKVENGTTSLENRSPAFLSDWPIKLACCRKQIEPGRHRIHLIGEVLSKDEMTCPDDTTPVALYVCDI
jgi:hypothetical protein